MKTYYECKVERAVLKANGSLGKVKETYIIDAVSFTEVESRMVRELAQYYEDFSVCGIRICAYQEVLPSDSTSDDRWYNVKVRIAQESKNGNITRKSESWLVAADSVRRSLERVDEFMRDSAVDYEVTSVVLSNVEDVLKYEPGSQDNTTPSEVERTISSMGVGATAVVSVCGREITLRRMDGMIVAEARKEDG